MGKHWSLPPAQIAPFTRTMILGTYNGELIFEEPMVTLAYLLSGASSTSEPPALIFSLASPPIGKRCLKICKNYACRPPVTTIPDIVSLLVSFSGINKRSPNREIFLLKYKSKISIQSLILRYKSLLYPFPSPRWWQ